MPILLEESGKDYLNDPQAVLGLAHHMLIVLKYAFDVF